MQCSECGRAIEAGDRFCTGCGIALHPGAEHTQPIPRVGARDPEDDIPAATDEPEITPTVSTDPVATPVTPADAPPPDLPVEQRTELVTVVDDEPWDDDPVWAATGSLPTQPMPSATGDLPRTQPITSATGTHSWMRSIVDAEADASTATPYDFVQSEHPTGVTGVAPTATSEMPVVVVQQHVVPATQRFRFGAVTGIGLLAGIVGLVALFATLVEITSSTTLVLGADAPVGFRTGRWLTDDLADNLAVAGLIAVLLMVSGGVAAGFAWRWGSGLAGGGGLAMAGLASMVLGMAQAPIDAAHEFAKIPNEQEFTLTITRGLGYWLVVAAAALGIVVFFAAINDAFGDRRSGLNPWIAALGALATVIAVGGPMLPEGRAVFSDNWYLTDGPGRVPALLLVGRLVQLGLLAVTGVVGFLTVRRWGLGVAIGGALPSVWLAASTLFDLTDRPIGPGYRNPGADEMHLHGVTIIGVSAIAAMTLLAVIGAYDQGVRERPHVVMA